MAYGSALVDNIQSSTAGTPVVFKDGNGTAIGTLCRAWVNFNGTGTIAIRSSFNVSSITDNGTGDYTVNFTNSLPDANYIVVSCGAAAFGQSGSVGAWFSGVTTSSATDVPLTKTTSAVRVSTSTITGTALVDAKEVYYAFFD